MSLKYALHLSASERPALTRIAQGRGGRRRPPLWPAVRARALLKCDAGPQGAGWTDEAVAAALDVSAVSVSRWRRQAVDQGPAAALTRQPKVPRARRLDGAGEAQLLQLAQSAPPAGQARWTLRALARELVTRGIASRISYETVRRVLKKELTPWRRVQRCYPPVSPEADFVIRMERVLDRYSRPYDARYPVICMDEHAQCLRADKWPAHPARPGPPATYDYEYVRCGACTIWMFVEPLGQWRTARVTARRTAVDWAHQVKALADHPRYRHAQRLILVCDNLNTHTYRSFFRAFPRAEAERLVRRVCLVFTPRHGSWLNMAEPELSVLTRQALSPRMPTQDAVHAQVTAWAEARNAAQKGIDWQFRTADARVRLKHLYHSIET